RPRRFPHGVTAPRQRRECFLFPLRKRRRNRHPRRGVPEPARAMADESAAGGGTTAAVGGDDYSRGRVSARSCSISLVTDWRLACLGSMSGEPSRARAPHRWLASVKRNATGWMTSVG